MVKKISAAVTLILLLLLVSCQGGSGHSGGGDNNTGGGDVLPPEQNEAGENEAAGPVTQVVTLPPGAGSVLLQLRPWFRWGKYSGRMISPLIISLRPVIQPRQQSAPQEQGNCLNSTSSVSA